jgi:serine protease Do
MFSISFQNPIRKFVAAAAVIAASATVVTDVSADAENYQRTLGSTTWVIASDADDSTSSGTGVLVDAERKLMITNAHVVGDSRKVVVFFPDEKKGASEVKKKHYLDNILKIGLRGNVLAVDRKRDLALVELNRLPEGAKAVQLAEKSITPGSRVDSIGNPGASDVLWVYTSGTVRSVYEKQFRTSAGDHQFKVVETQSPINTGDSGGPVVDADGKLIGIAQSFSEKSNLVSYCVDVTEIKEFMESGWKPAPLPAKVLLDKADLPHKKHSSGHYEVDVTLDSGKTQSIFVAKDIEYYERADVRKLWTLVSTTKQPPSAEVMMKLLRLNSATKIGSWAIEQNSAGESMVMYAAKIDATATHDALRSTLEYIAKVSIAMKEELSPKATEKTASETLASWLAK